MISRIASFLSFTISVIKGVILNCFNRPNNVKPLEFLILPGIYGSSMSNISSPVTITDTAGFL